METRANKNMTDRPHVLVVDDDDRIRALVSRYLSEHEFVVATAHDAAEARGVMQRLAFDALVVDIMMPGQSGLDFVRDLRTRDDVPVLFLTALGEAHDRISGLETGADDYLAKPFEPRELVLRLHAILRRRPQARDELQPFRMGMRRYEPAHNELHEDDGTVTRLTTVEGNLLRALAQRAGEVVSREELAELCQMDAGERTIDVQVTRLRRKVEDDVKRPHYLQTVRGRGYLLRIEEL